MDWLIGIVVIVVSIGVSGVTAHFITRTYTRDLRRYETVHCSICHTGEREGQPFCCCIQAAHHHQFKPEELRGYQA